MAIKYSGAAKTAVINAGTRTELVDNLKQALVDAGWTVVSGSSGDWKLNSGVTPSGHQIRIRLYDPGGSNQCARARMMTVNETIAPDVDLFLLAQTGRTYRVFACPYQFFVLCPGSVETRGFLAGGVPALPSFLNPTHVGWMHDHASNDTDPWQRHSFRRSSETLHARDVGAVAIYGNTGWGAHSGYHEMTILVRMEYWKASYKYQWADGSLVVYDPLIMWPLQAPGNEYQIVGQLWDTIVVHGEWVMDEIITFDGKQWWCVFYGDNANPKVTLAVLYPTT